MKSDRPVSNYRRLRGEPLWRLLAADNAPVVLGLLQTHLYEPGRSLSASRLLERIDRDLEHLRAQGEDLPQSAKAYVSAWLNEGWLERRFPPGATEEEYELSTASVAAIRFVSGLEQRRAAFFPNRSWPPMGSRLN